MGKEYKPHSGRERQIAFAVVLCIVLVQNAAGANAPQSATYKRDVAEAFEAELSKVLADQDAKTVKVARLRIGLMDQLAHDILADLESLNADVLGEELDVLSGSSRQASRKLSATSRTAAEMAEAYLADLPDVSGMPAEKLADLKQLETRRLRAASRLVLDVGKGTVPANDQAQREIVEKSSLLALLAVADEAWSEADVKTLPEWVRQGQKLAVVEAFALQIKRPQTAYQMHLYAAAGSTDTTTGRETYLQYLMRVAESFRKSKEYELAMHCLETGLRPSACGKQAEACGELRYQLAVILNEQRHPELALEQTRQALAVDSTSAMRGKLAAMHLMCLYQTKQFSDVTKEAAGFIGDPKCQPYLPYILYIQWLAFQSLDEEEQAGKVQREFLGKFPSHSLAMDMYYASATDAIVQGNLGEANQLLDKIEGQAPSAEWIAKVKSLRESLRQISATQ